MIAVGMTTMSHSYLYRRQALDARRKEAGFVSSGILSELLKIRRRYSGDTPDSDTASEVKQVAASLLPAIEASVAAQRPIEFVLPAFPAKSPNPDKVLGRLPDMAERLSLAYLNQLCERIQGLHEPGAKLVICSDGRVFGDIIRVTDQDINAYQGALKKLLTTCTPII